MLIELTIKRPQGSSSTMDGELYEFLPNNAGDHVCEVTNESHIKRFLYIGAYRAYDVVDKAIDIAKAEGATPVVVDYKDEPALLSDGMSDDEMQKYAIDVLGIDNPEDKEEIAEYAIEMLSLKLNKSKKAINMLKEVIDAQSPSDAE